MFTEVTCVYGFYWGEINKYCCILVLLLVCKLWDLKPEHLQVQVIEHLPVIILF